LEPYHKNRLACHGGLDLDFGVAAYPATAPYRRICLCGLGIYLVEEVDGNLLPCGLQTGLYVDGRLGHGIDAGAKYC
jgi:hypothetical protein